MGRHVKFICSFSMSYILYSIKKNCVTKLFVHTSGDLNAKPRGGTPQCTISETMTGSYECSHLLVIPVLVWKHATYRFFGPSLSLKIRYGKFCVGKRSRIWIQSNDLLMCSASPLLPLPLNETGTTNIWFFSSFFKEVQWLQEKAKSQDQQLLRKLP